MSRALSALLIFLAIGAAGALSSCANPAPGEDPLRVSFPDVPEAGPTGPRVPFVGEPRLRSPMGESPRVTSYVTHSSGGHLVDYACNRITRSNHKGTDFGVPRGTPVYASAAGTVLRSVDGCPEGDGSCGGGFGNHVILLHAGGRATLYAHLTSGSGLPRSGATVSCGQGLGLSGNTGRSTGPHLHFEVRDGVSDVGSYYASGPIDPFGGACSSQAEPLWADGAAPGTTCDGEEVGPYDDADFVSALLPRTVSARPGQRIVQRWRLSNTGNKSWTAGGYQLTFVSGENFGVSAPVPVSRTIDPRGEEVFEIEATAPTAPGAYKGTWRMGIAGEGVFGDEVFLAIQVEEPSGTGAGCYSNTLGRTAADGECVQVTYSACGATTCGWYVCFDGEWQCTEVSTCGGARAAHPECADVGECESYGACEGCAGQDGCGWCGREGRCVDGTDQTACPNEPTHEADACTECAPDGRVCTRDEDCCGSVEEGGSVTCLLGFCVDRNGCLDIGASCTNPTECCGGIYCAASQAGGSSQCCLRDEDRCVVDDDCCGEMTCSGSGAGQGGRCQCRQRGESCASIVDCCAGGLCEGGVCTQDDPSPPDDRPEDPGEELGVFWNTYYYFANEGDHSGAEDTTLYDASCRSITTTTAAFSDAVCVQGSGKLSDGRFIHYAGTCSCGRRCPTGGTVCYEILDAARYPWGIGNRSNPLEPFRSWATDRSIIPSGTVVYSPEWDGVMIPSVDGLGGFVHDGCFRADDVGGWITGKHIDFFAGTRSMWRAMEGVMPTRSEFHVYQNSPRCTHVMGM